MEFPALLERLRTSDSNQRYQLTSHLSDVPIPSTDHFLQLLSVLSEFIDDEICLSIEIATQLGKMASTFGPLKPMLEMLETLLQADDSYVRKEAGAVLASIAIQSNQGDALILPICSRLKSADCFMQKMGLPRLLSSSFLCLSPSGQAEAYSSIQALAQDPVMAVRKSAVESLSVLVENCPMEFQHQLLSLFLVVTADSEDMVRMITVESLAKFAARFLDEGIKPAIVRMVNSFGNDNAWKVRHQLATHISAFGTTLGKDTAVQILASIYSQLLQDEEAEVRNAACCNLAAFSEFLGPDTVAQKILPVILRLTTDLEFVRVTFAGQINKLCPIVGEQNTKLFLLEAMLELLRGDSAEIRIPLLKELESVKHVIGEESLAQNIMPALSELTNNRQWRVRLQIVELMPSFGRQLGEEFFTVHFVRVFNALVEDPVFTVREAALDITASLTDLFGVAWTQSHLLPLILDTRYRESYLHRLTALFGAVKIAPKLPPSFVSSDLVPIVQSMSGDPVPNIRMNAAKACWKLQPYVTDATPLGEVLETLRKDADFDVRYAAECVR